MTQNEYIVLPKLISDGMVLQRDSLIRIWGKSLPGAMMKITFLEEKYQTKVDENGGWEITWKDLLAGGPHEMIIECEDEKKVIKDILIGDVWVLGGQSNMELGIRRTLDLFEDEVKNANYSSIRKFSVPQNYDFHGPVEELTGGEWISVTPQSVYDFSAIGYFYAKKLYDIYKVPIGLLHTAMGGTPVEAWISEKSLMRFGRFEEILSLCKDDDYVKGTKKREEMYNNDWYSNLYKKDQGLHDEKAPWYSEDCDDSDWNQIELPATFRGTELETVRGSVWFRKEIFISDTMVNGKAKLVLGTLIDGDETYINGVQVGNTGYLYPPRRYEVPDGLLRSGKNILAVRLILTQSIGAFITDKPYFLQYNKEELAVSGTWKYRIGTKTEAQKPTTFFQYKPTGVFNGMIYPLRKYSIKGALWYQGESNTAYPNGYKELFEAVINDWRATWAIGDFPFFYVQLANHCPWRMEPEMSGWARIRDEQRRAMELPNTGMAVIIDAGEYNDLHPQNKKTVGERLALWTMNQVYNDSVVCSGPIYDFMDTQEEIIKLHFSHIGSGLVAKGGELKTFSICGPEGIFVDAKAKIDGDTVIVSRGTSKEPICVRYAWSDNPEEANLYNQEGLPASPFSTKL